MKLGSLSLYLWAYLQQTYLARAFESEPRLVPPRACSEFQIRPKSVHRSCAAHGLPFKGCKQIFFPGIKTTAEEISEKRYFYNPTFIPALLNLFLPSGIINREEVYWTRTKTNNFPVLTKSLFK